MDKWESCDQKLKWEIMKVRQEADFRFLKREGSCIQRLKAMIP